MAGDSKRPEGAEIASILESEQAEWDDDKKNCLLVDVPAEQERSIAAESDCRNEVVPCRR